MLVDCGQPKDDLNLNFNPLMPCGNKKVTTAGEGGSNYQGRGMEKQLKVIKRRWGCSSRGENKPV